MSLAPGPHLDAARSPSPAVAPPPGNPRFALFDSLRGMAVLGVLLFHVAGVTGAINTSGSGDLIAVLNNESLIVFFAISGFLLYRPYALARCEGRPRPRTARYARRRLLRIVPAYWTALTVLAIFPGITGVFTADWWRYYFFLQAYSSRTVGLGIPAAWTLCVEVSFYLSLPLWAVLVSRLRREPSPASELIPLALVAAVGVLVQVAASRLEVSSLLTTTLPGECVWFVLGMALAVLSVEEQQRAGRWRAVEFVTEHPSFCWAGAALCIAFATIVLHPGGLFNIILSLRTKQPYGRTIAGIFFQGAACVLVVAPAVFGEGAKGLPRRLLGWAPLAWVGLVSYGIYLYQLAIVELLGEETDAAHFSATGLGLVHRIHTLTTPILLALSFAGSAVVAAISYYLVELRFLRRKER